MLSLYEQSGKLKKCENLIPSASGTLRSRPGGIQVVSGDVINAKPWGDKALLEKNGRLIIWDGIEKDIAPAGYQLQAVPYQAYTNNALRENRLYVADGVNPLWYLFLENGSYKQKTVINSITDENNIPYPLPIPKTIANWKNRLFISDGSNRAQHCQNNKPEEWDPLWSLEFQAEEPGTIRVLKASGSNLFVGLEKSCFAVSGTSQLNWVRDPLFNASGIIGSDAVAVSTKGTFWVSRSGIESGEAPVSINDIKNTFLKDISDAHIEIDEKRGLLLTLIDGRLFVMHLDFPGLFGEIKAKNIRGLISFSDSIGWYGEEGLWILGSEEEPDRLIDGSYRDFDSVYETWEETPNVEGGSRLHRVFIKLKGSSRGKGTYSLKVDGKNEHSEQFELTDYKPVLGSDIVNGASGEYFSPLSLINEFTPSVVGSAFSHRVFANCYIEILNFNAKYKFKGQ